MDGTVAFVPVEKDFWGNPDPGCFDSITVYRLNEVPAQVEVLSDKPNPAREIVWQDEEGYGSCVNEFPVTYGSELLGKDENCLGGVCKHVSASPLEPGGIYEIQTSGAAGFYGEGKFMYGADGSVTNLKQ